MIVNLSDRKRQKALKIMNEQAEWEESFRNWMPYFVLWPRTIVTPNGYRYFVWLDTIQRRRKTDKKYPTTQNGDWFWDYDVYHEREHQANGGFL